MNCILVDDDKLSIEILKDHLEESPYCRRLFSFSSPREFLKKAHDLNFDLLLLDIVMPEIDGFSIAKAFPNKPVIFMTGYEKRLKEATNLCPLGVLSKPVTKEKLNILLETAQKVINSNTKDKEYQLFNYLDPSGKIRIKLSDILYVKTQYEKHRNKYVILKDGKKYLLSNVSFEELLNASPNLIRINKSELISMEAFLSIVNDIVQLKDVIIDGRLKQVYLNRWFKKDFLSRLKNGSG
jgi:two-component system LytT family response regulator